MKKISALIAMLVIGVFLLLSLPLYEDIPVDPLWEMSVVENPPNDAVTVRFTGTSTLLAAVIPMHSHCDHAMDSPEVARRTNAVLMGSASTANIGRGWGLPEKQIRVFQNRVPVRIGDFEITPIESKHFEFAQAAMRERALRDPDITEPLIPPVAAFDYRLGKAYVLHIRHPKGNFAIVGSAGYDKDGLQGLQADVVFLGIGGLGSQSQAYREAYWEETVGTLQSNLVIPIHYDSLTAPIEGPFRGTDLLMSMLSGGSENTLSFLRAKQADNPLLVYGLLPRYDEIVLFD
jgi:L-ascorbate metabolism protein UlaG (beta-lactamase superfamily)